MVSVVPNTDFIQKATRKRTADIPVEMQHISAARKYLQPEVTGLELEANRKLPSPRIVHHPENLTEIIRWARSLYE